MCLAGVPFGLQAMKVHRGGGGAKSSSNRQGKKHRKRQSQSSLGSCSSAGESREAQDPCCSRRGLDSLSGGNYATLVSQVILKAGHVQPVWAGHPWIYPQGIAEFRGNPNHGDEVEVRDSMGNSMGRGFFSKGSAIAVRLFTSDPERGFDEALMVDKFLAALDLRKKIGLLADAAGQMRTNAYRAFHGEGDGLPGLIVDRFDDVLVIQLGTAGLFRRRALILDALQRVFAPRAIFDRTSEKTAAREGFQACSGLAFGGSVPHLSVLERGLLFEIPLTLGQKTGFYFDQRPLRARIEELSRGKKVLDCYCFVGATGLFAKRGGASEVLCVDSSASAIEAGQAMARQNSLEVSFKKAKAPEFLASEERSWDIVIADPPKLAQSRAAQPRAMKAFRRISAAAVRATRPGGLVVLSSCSAALGIAEVERCLALGARDVSRRSVVVERLFQGGDHPVHPAFPEGRYLSSVIAYVE
jgi:23S rRNA (cytosine1962-C5)-methyltransferase